jgi:Protein of unknown function (DUF2469)
MEGLRSHNGSPMSEEEIEKFETDAELALFREYRDVLPMFTYAIETERRFYLAHQVDIEPHEDGPWFEVILTDVWVWDMYRSARFVPRVRVVTTQDVNVEELRGGDDGIVPPHLR